MRAWVFGGGGGGPIDDVAVAQDDQPGLPHFAGCIDGRGADMHDRAVEYETVGRDHVHGAGDRKSGVPDKHGPLEPTRPHRARHHSLYRTKEFG